MSAMTLAVGALLDVASVGLFTFAGALVTRTIPRDDARARDGFAAFFYGVALVNLLQAVLIAAALADVVAPAFALAMWQTRIALALASFAGLVYYLTYVYTGRRGWLMPVALFYVLTFLLMMTWLAGNGAVSVKSEPWRIGLGFAATTTGLLYRVVVLMFFVPPFLAAGAYGLLLRHVHGPLQRRRVRLVGASLAVYFLGLTLGYLEVGWYWWGLAENVLGLLAAAGVIHALSPSSTRAPAATPV